MIKKIIYKISRSIAKKFGYKLVKKENDDLNFQFPEYTDDELKLIKICKKKYNDKLSKIKLFIKIY